MNIRLNVGSAAAILVALALLHIWALMRYPAPFVDEAWFADRAWSVVARGETLGSLDFGVVNQFQGSWLFFPLLPVLAQAAVLAVAGEPSLFALRALSLTMGAGLLAAVWSIARTTHDHATALLSVVLLGLSAPFLISSHLARYDVMAAALAWAGIALYLRKGPRRAWLAALGGLCAGLAVEVHPFAVVVALALPVLAIYDAGWRVHRDRVSRSLALGLLAGAALYPAIHIFPNPQTYVSLGKIVYGPTHVPDLTALGDAIVGSLRLSFYAVTFALPVLIWAVARTSMSREPGERRLALLALTVFAAFTVLVRNKLPYYAILFLPGLVLCLAVALRRAVGRWRTYREAGFASLTLGIVLVAGSCALSIGSLRVDGNAAFRQIQRRLATAVEPGQSIMGPQTYWFGFSGQCYYSWEQLIYLQRLHEGTSAIEALAKMRPDVLIRDGHLDAFILDQPGDTLYQRLLRLPKTEVETWLAANSAVVADFDGGIYGRVRVYRLWWADAGSPRNLTDGCREADDAKDGRPRRRR